MKNITKLFYLVSLAAVLLLGFSCSDKTTKKETVDNTIAFEATPFPLSQTRLLDGSPFKHAMDKDAEWLLDLEPDRFLHRFRLNAGLKPKGEIYSGWESMGVSGHTLGHYLSACAMMYAASGDRRFKERVDYIVKELAECQNARKTGYVGGIPDEDRIWNEISKGDIRYTGFDLNGGWVPWYTQHKIWAGLIDAYLYADSEQAKEVVTKLSDWAVKMFGGLSEEKFQQMIACEFGGMNESFAEMYAITGNKTYLDMAEKFYHKAVLDPLKEQRDELEGKHSNTQVPKIIGAARMYELTGNKDYHTIATYYWDRMVNHHSYLNGGNSNYEHLGAPDKLNDRLSASTSETCNTYNMLKLTKHLFSWDAQASYYDYYERALYNHILASQNPDDGMVCYYVALESGTKKAFSSRYDSFWCCVASGLENHVKYAESVFFKAKDGGLYVNLFIPTELNWKEKGLKVRLETKFPEENKITLTFDGSEKEFPLHIRYPKWAVGGLKASVNGKDVKVDGKPGSYFTLNGKWGKGTVLALEIPMSTYTESMPDNAGRLGFFYGPVLLSAGLGEKKPEVYEIPVFVSETNDVAGKLVPVTGKALTFTSGNATSPANINFMPFYKMYGQNHAVYFDVFTPQAWAVKEKEYRLIIEKQKAIEARTIDGLRVGEIQPERDHNLKSENSGAGEAAGYKFRDADNGWFSFDMKVDPTAPQQLMCKYWGADKDKRHFDIFIDDVLFREVSLTGDHGEQVFDVYYNIPASFIKGKNKVTVKFKARPGNHAGGLFGLAILKK